MSIFQPKWNTPLGPRLHLFERGGKVIGSVITGASDDHDMYLALALDHHLNYTGDPVERTCLALDEAKDFVEEIAWNKNSK